MNQDPTKPFVDAPEQALPAGEPDPAADLGNIVVRDESAGSEQVNVGVAQASTTEAGPREADEAVAARHEQSGAVRADAFGYGPRRPSKPEFHP